MAEAKPVIRVSASKHGGKSKRHAVAFNLRRAENGFTGHTEFEQPRPRGGKRGSMMNALPYEEPMTTVHPDLQSVHDHLAEHFGSGSSGAAEDENAPGRAAAEKDDEEEEEEEE